MSSLGIRRLVVWAVSIVLGIVTSLLVITFFLPAVSPSPSAQSVSVVEYGYQYFLWTALPLSLMFMTILDHFMETRIWPD